MWTELWLGRYAGKTLPQVAFRDPDWVFWAVEEGIFDGDSGLDLEAQKVADRARRIFVPGSDVLDFEVEYVLHWSSRKLYGVQVVRASQKAHAPERTLRRGHFDLSLPRQLAPYDKRGGKILIKAIKKYVFGSESYILNRKRVEEFFEDPKNFELPVHG